jgi:hypothetical protein
MPEHAAVLWQLGAQGNGPCLLRPGIAGAGQQASEGEKRDRGGRRQITQCATARALIMSVIKAD